MALLLVVPIVPDSTEKRIVLTVFLAYWAGIIILSLVAPYGGYSVSGRVYGLVSIFLCCFCLGCALRRGVHVKNSCFRGEADLLLQYDKNIGDNRFILALTSFMCIALLYYAVKYASFLSTSSIAEVRTARYFVGGLFGSTIELLFYNYIIASSRFLFAFIAGFSLSFGRLKQPVAWLSIIGLTLYSFVGSSRFPLILLAVDALLLMLFKGFCFRQHSVSKTGGLLPKLIGVVIFVCGAMLYLTAVRRGMSVFSLEALGSSLKALWTQVVGYSVGPLSGLSYLLSEGAVTEHYYAGYVAVFNGCGELLDYVLSLAGIELESPKAVLATLANNEIVLGDASFNALYSCIYWFYADSGVMGVICFSLLFGLIVGQSFLHLSKSHSIQSLMIVVHVSYFVLMSNMIWQIGNVDSLLYIVVLVVWDLRRRSANRNEVLT